ncbi:UNVERIFIED_CONTAM: uncharacterized protein DUF3263 [Williamsia faeni]
MSETDALKHEMLEFEARWFRLGGGPSHEILSRFGMTDRTFFAEIDALMDERRALDHFTPRDTEVIRAVIRRRLWLAN